MNQYACRLDCGWTLSGYYHKQWRPGLNLELGMSIRPVVPDIPAAVPGAVHSDLAAAGWLEDWQEGLNSLHNEWVEHRDWIYTNRFQVPPGFPEGRLELVFEGLDYWGQIRLNGAKLTEFEGMFTPLVLDISETVRLPPEHNTLEVIFYMPPEEDGQIGYSSRIRRLKSRFNYVWDWCPRAVNIGIWRDVWLKARPVGGIADFYPKAAVAGVDGQLVCETRLEHFPDGDYRFRYRLTHPDGRRATWEWTEPMSARRPVARHTLPVADVALWWPNGMGEQALYKVRLEVSTAAGSFCDSAERAVGFRTVAFARTPGAPADALPYALVVNGVPVAVKGVNWVPVSPFYGAVTAAQYERQIGMFRQLHCNLLRVWGGAIIETEAFYSECDRQGLLVWQELLQSSSGISNNPSIAPEFLAALARAAEQAILEKRGHACLAVWCGGNELLWDGHIPLDGRHENIAMLKRLVQRLDPDRMFLPTSPTGPTFSADAGDFGKGMHHDVHGPWMYLAERHYDFFNRDDSLLRTETGTMGILRYERLTALAGGCKLWPPTHKNPFWLHRGAWWINWELMNHVFGPWSEHVEEMHRYTRLSRYLQAESLRYAAESVMRRYPACSGIVIWMGNEPYANAINNSLLEYDGVPRPAYYAVQRAFADYTVSAMHDSVAIQSGTALRCRLSARAALPALCQEAVLDAALYNLQGDLLHHQAYPRSLGEGGGPAEFTWDAAPQPGSMALLQLRLSGQDGATLAENEYLYMIDPDHLLEPLRRYPATTVQMAQQGDRLLLTNTGAHTALGVTARPADPSRTVYFADNFRCILPGKTIALRLHGEAPPNAYVLEGINLNEPEGHPHHP